MPSEPNRVVREPPSKPLLVFDGDCHFCRQWIERWRGLTAGKVDYAPFQEVAARFPEIPGESFDRAVRLIEPDGRVVSGAEAIFRSLSYKAGCQWMIRAYQHFPGFASATEAAYRQIARHRRFASFLTGLLWGPNVRVPSYVRSRRWFLRGLGGVYLIAFLSLWVQVNGLIGSNGILPIADYLGAARDQLGHEAVFRLPTFCWINSSDQFLSFLCGGGVAMAVLLIAGFLPGISLTVLFVFYLSLTVAGQTFFSFQWDILLLETGFLSFFFAPWRVRGNLWPLRRRAQTLPDQEPPVSGLGLFLIKLLLFKLMLMSGVVKLTSGDNSWWDLTALNYHYETQPLPTVLGWWAHQGPEWFRKASTFAVLAVETVVPFFIWGPRRLRHGACGLLILLQVAIALTGNYCFFNLLTIVLCLALLDDSYWTRKHVSVGRDAVEPADAASLDMVRGSSYLPGATARRAEARPTISSNARRLVTVTVLAIFLPINGMLILSAFKPRIEWPRSIGMMYEAMEPFRVVSGYGLFRVMTKSRPEIIIEGSNDGVEWKAYEFKWKPGLLNQPPRWVAPHQPRLDWQMWFAALGNYRRNPWFMRLAECLLRNNPEVTRFLARNPFSEQPPRYIRAMLYDYHFTSIAEWRETGDWWKREERGEYLPPISLK